MKNTTPSPILMSTYAYEKKLLSSINNNNLHQQQQQQQQQHHQAKKDIDIEDESQPSFMSLNLNHEEHKQIKLNQEHGINNVGQDDVEEEAASEIEEDEEEHDENIADDNDEIANHVGHQEQPIKEHARELLKANEQQISLNENSGIVFDNESKQQQQLSTDLEGGGEEEHSAADNQATEENAAKLTTIDNNKNSHEVDEHVKQISHKIEKIVNNEQIYPSQHHPHAHFHHQDINNNNNNNDDDDDDDSNRQSFLSLTDLIRTLRPNDKQIIPQIDSDYSNAMRVLGENTGPLMKSDDQQPRGNNNFRDNLDFSTH